MHKMGTDPGLVEFLHGVQPQLGRLALVLTGDHERAQDLTQDTLVKVIGKWDRVNDSSDSVGYACRMMINHWRDDSRRSRAQLSRRLHQRSPTQPEEDGVLDRITLSEAMACLTARQRAVLYFRFYEDCSVREVARRMDCSQGTVKSQTHEALRALRVLATAAPPRDSTISER